jgi:hypothetical protein
MSIEPVVAPFDAYETAKPNEPTFTLQGGDPLGAPLVRLWAVLARVQSGMGASITEAVIQSAVKTACTHVSEGNSETKALLVRATEAEKVSWLMDEYIKGIVSEGQAPAKVHNEFERLDVYDIRRRMASVISDFFSNLEGHRQELLKHEFITEGDKLDNEIFGAILGLRAIKEQIEIRRRT